MGFWRLSYILILSSLLRLGFLIYGLVQDKYSAVKYTDIDYLVFTDAARYISYGQSPYLRETYRYTPLLAWILLPTTWQGLEGAWFSFGKVIFAAADIVAGWLLYLVLRMESGRIGREKSQHMTEEQALKYASVWLLNPMVITISTRGSSEGLLGAMVVAMVWAAMSRRPALTGFFLGLGVHFKIYPFIYAPSLLLFFSSTAHPPSTAFSARTRHFLNRDRIILTITASLTFTSLNWAMYALYGFPFIQHTFLHHLTRIDHRHNFSPYNTLLYASSAASHSPNPTVPSTPTLLSTQLPPLESLAFLPQLSLSAVLLPLILSTQHLPSTLLAQTWAFVALNKVCTSQYFLWYLVLLPLYLPYSRFVRRSWLGLAALGLWVGAQGVWLGEGFRLEFLGESRFVPGLWAAGLGFLAVNMWVLGGVVGDVGVMGMGMGMGMGMEVEVERGKGKGKGMGMGMEVEVEVERGKGGEGGEIKDRVGTSGEKGEIG